MIRIQLEESGMSTLCILNHIPQWQLSPLPVRASPSSSLDKVSSNSSLLETSSIFMISIFLWKSTAATTRSRPTVVLELQTSTGGGGECWYSRGHAARWRRQWGLPGSQWRCLSFRPGTLDTTPPECTPHCILQEPREESCRVQAGRQVSSKWIKPGYIDAGGLVCRLPAFDTHRRKLANLPTYLSKIRLQLIVHDRQLYSPLLVSYRKWWESYYLIASFPGWVKFEPVNSKPVLF